MLTEAQRQDLLSRHSNITKPQSSQESSDAFLESLNPEKPKKESLLKGLAKGIAQPFVKAGVSGYESLKGVGALGNLAIDRMSGGGLSEEEKQKFISKGQNIQQGVNVPGFGQVEPVKTAREAVGVGLEIGSYFAGGGTVAGATKLFGKPALLQAMKTGAIQGAIEGGLGGVGVGLQDEEAVVGDVVKSGAMGTLAGGVLGGAAPAVSKGVSKTVFGAKKVAQKAKNVTGDIVEINIPRAFGRATAAKEKLATNMATRRSAEKAIQQLPTKTAQKAARLGIDVQDINTLSRIKPKTKPAVKELLKSAEDFSSGVSRVRPEEVVGKPITKALKTLEKKRGAVGQKLGNIAQDLGTVSKEELKDNVFNKLKKEIGGLEIKNGKLNFKNTVLTTRETLSDRKAIQSIFEQAIQSGSGSSKHRLRQELFEILGGKKKSLANITGTQERAYNAVRQALSDVLDTKNSAYKSLNKEYAKLTNPLLDLRKMMIGVEGADEDIGNMLAGLLSRRLTSNTASGVKLRKVLTDIDKILKGETLSSLSDLQDVYNVLDKYYDISGKTSLKGIIKSSVPTKAGDLSTRVFDKLTEDLAETPEVRQKALKELIEELIPTKNKTNFGK